MSSRPFPFAVRLIGFRPEEAQQFDAVFAVEQGKGYGYFCLQEDNLQDPDLYIANADDLRTLARLSDLRPSAVRPALLIGRSGTASPYAHVERPIQWHRVFEALDSLVEKRADTLSRLEASDIVTVPERRRLDRPGPDLADPAEYERMRAKVPENGVLLVVDKSAALRDHLARMLGRYRQQVEWVDDETAAVELCRRRSVALVMVNTSTPNVDPYRLCKRLKVQAGGIRIVVVFLVGANFAYDVPQARAAGADGYLTKPLVSQHLLNALKKFLPNIR